MILHCFVDIYIQHYIFLLFWGFLLKITCSLYFKFNNSYLKAKQTNKQKTTIKWRGGDFATLCEYLVLNLSNNNAFSLWSIIHLLLAFCHELRVRFVIFLTDAGSRMESQDFSCHSKYYRLKGLILTKNLLGAVD